MIIDLDQPLYVVDELVREHRVVSIDIREKTVTCEDGEVFEYGTNADNLTVVIKNITNI